MHPKHLLYCAALVGAALFISAPVTSAPEDPGATSVTINGNHRLVRYGPDGDLAGGGESSVIIDTRDQLGGMAIAPNGDVYININGNHRVLRYGADGASLGGWSVELARGEKIAGIAVGPGGVYININGNHRVLRYNFDGTDMTEWPIDADRSSNVVDIAVDPETGEVLVLIETREIIFGLDFGGE